MGTLQHKLGRGLFTTAAALAIAFGGFATSAYALSVTGTDFYGNGSLEEAASSNTISVLSVSGVSQDTLFLHLEQDGKVIADRLEYKLSDASQSGSTATDANRGATVSLDVDNLNLSGSSEYTLKVYTNRAETEQLGDTYTIHGVYAQLNDEANTKVLVGTHTSSAALDASDISYTPSTKLYLNGANYKLASEQPSLSGSALVYSYESYDEATTAEGTITYVDVNGTTIKTDTYPGIAAGDAGKEVKIEKTVSCDVNGQTQYFRTVFYRDSVTLSNPGQLAYTITCKWLGSASSSDAGFYVANISMKDTAGNTFAADTVSVTGATYNYTLPSVVYKRANGKLYKYTLKTGEAQVRTFAADGTSDKNVTAYYDVEEVNQAKVTVTFRMIDGSKDAGESRLLGTKQVELSATGATTATPDSKYIASDGTVYELAGTTEKYAYTLGSSATPVVDVYYLPEGYKVPTDEYTVTVNYVNFRTKKTIQSSTFQSKSTDNQNYEFPSAETFSKDGVDYIRLDGQEEPISHSYYSKIKTYTVYYRDKNDTYLSGTVINRIRVVYTGETTTDEGTTTTTTGTTGTSGTTTNASGQTGDATTAADVANGALSADGTYSVADGDGNNSTLTNEAGVDSNTERINDDETPLASGVAGTGLSPVAVGTAAGVGIGLAGLLILLIAKKRSHKTEEQN